MDFIVTVYGTETIADPCDFACQNSITKYSESRFVLCLFTGEYKLCPVKFIRMF